MIALREKFIVNSVNGASVFIVGSYCNKFSYIKQLVEEAKKDFPSLKDEDIEISKIYKSRFVKDFSVIQFSLPTGTYHPEYTQRTDVGFSW